MDRLVGTARALGHEVAWALHAEPGTGSAFDPASGFVRLMDGLAADPGDVVVTKTSRHAFTTTNLAQHLTTAGATDLVIAGIQTEQCVPDRLRDGLVASGATVESAANAVGFVDARMLRHLRSRARDTSCG